MKKALLLLIVLTILLYLIPLNVRVMFSPDETRYAEIGREMIVSGDWVTPRLNGVLYFEKPVFGYWAFAVSQLLFGEHAFAIRLPCVLATLLSALALFFLTPEGEAHYYDKHHLFRIGHETEHYSPGNERPIINFRGWNILLLICYDLRFPVWSRNRNNEYDLLIYVANWPASRRRVWDILLHIMRRKRDALPC